MASGRASLPALQINISTTAASKVETFVGFNDKASGEKLFKFASENTNVEFARIDGSRFGTEEASYVFSSQNSHVVENQPQIAVGLSNTFFQADNVDHSHPFGNPVPSGHYGIEEGNPNSLTPVPGKKIGDAENARQLSKLKGFENAKFSVYNPKGKTTTTYNG